MHLLMPLLLSAVLFGIGIYGVLARRNAILILMSVELMLNASTVALIAFDVWLKQEQRLAGTIAWDLSSSGQSLAVFIINHGNDHRCVAISRSASRARVWPLEDGRRCNSHRRNRSSTRRGGICLVRQALG